MGLFLGVLGGRESPFNLTTNVHHMALGPTLIVGVSVVLFVVALALKTVAAVRIQNLNRELGIRSKSSTVN